MFLRINRTPPSSEEPEPPAWHLTCSRPHMLLMGFGLYISATKHFRLCRSFPKVGGPVTGVSG